MSDGVESFLAHFPGPKGENAPFIREMLDLVIDDYFHWRRNYYPDDQGVLTSHQASDLSKERSDLLEKVEQLLGQLRRSFPFYSPRYIAHQQGETTIAALVGSLAGMLYNSNNVTSETGAVTLEYEIDACSKILTMVGFTPPPRPPKVIDGASLASYHAALSRPYSWSHLTSGGTVANIEALWVARQVRYLPLSLLDVAKALQLDLKFGSTGSLLRSYDYKDVLTLTPNATIELFKDYLEISAKKCLDPFEAMRTHSKYSLGDGISRAMVDFPPAIFVSGAAHYSIAKALDILGIGSSSLIRIDTDDSFRLRTSDLRLKITDALERGMVPLAVVAIAGSTEEGSVDPIGEISALRDELASRGAGFWLHIDGAWGGYFRTLLIEDDISTIRDRVERSLGVTDSELADSPTDLAHLIEEKLGLAKSKDEPFLRYMAILLRRGEIEEAAEISQYLGSKMSYNANVDSLISTSFEVQHSSFQIETNTFREFREVADVSFNDRSVIEALGAFGSADSITVDPHKMGYVNYPCGTICFKEDLVRYLVRQKAPYITVASNSSWSHRPPRHLVEGDAHIAGASFGKVATEAFAAYTLEGSRPSFPATALWLSSEMLPLNRMSHGRVIRASWIAARELFEWLTRLDRVLDETDVERLFKTVPYCHRDGKFVPPDTNINVFGFAPRDGGSLRDFNSLSEAIYRHFSIRAEHGERQYSYSQPFFLSKTSFTADHYSFTSLSSIFASGDIEADEDEYRREGLVVLRSTIMNPYLTPLRESNRGEIIREFALAISEIANIEVRKLAMA